jgi:SpoVK/Ycf46/Vps4 family AAA+-type ATPase
LALRESVEAKDVKKKHFDEALKKVKPSVTKSTLETYKRIEEAFLQSAKSAVPIKGGSYLG